MARAVRKLKSGKAGGVCSIQVEMVKAGGYTVVQWLKDSSYSLEMRKYTSQMEEGYHCNLQEGSRDECW